MSKMIIKTLWGQMPESYEGEHAPELLCAADEWTMEANTEYWEDEKKRACAGNYAANFETIREIDIEVDQDRIREILVSSPKVDGKVL